MYVKRGKTTKSADDLGYVYEHKKTYKTTNRLKIKYRIRKIIKHCRYKQKTDSNERHIKERMK